MVTSIKKKKLIQANNLVLDVPDVTAKIYNVFLNFQ